MTYTAQKTRLNPTADELRARIPGWGVDLDPRDRPGHMKERYVAGETGAHWEFPERQPERWLREKTPEHKFLTPVFGTACPPRGVSGALRRYAYKFSEGKLSHWLILMGADRIDVAESRLAALLRGQPDNMITETGILSELKKNGWKARFNRKRADTKHQVLDPVVAAVDPPI
jgi:hypothetical protein